jgi:predicted dinucleotide-binding enzyme
MTTLGIIGSGNIGSTVAHLAVAAGHDVVLANSRGPETLVDLVAELGPRARAATAQEAARAGDLVVVAVPLKAVGQLPADALRGKVVLDTGNYYPERDGQVPELDEAATTTSELVQRALPGSAVVKVFNNIFFKALRSLARPAGDPDRSGLLIAGDDAGAKTRVTALLDDLGFDAVDAGSLADSWRFERDAPAYGVPYATDGVWTAPRSASAAELLAAAAQARR